jgi:ubiquinone biosynthesis protein
VFVMPKTGEIVFIDVGMTGSLDARQRGQLVDLMRGLAQRDTHRLTNVVLDLGETFKPVDEAALERDIDRLVRRHLTGSLVDFSYARFLSELLAVLFDNGVRTPSDLLFALKAIMQTEQIVRTLNPDFNISDLANTAGSLVLAHQLRPSQVRAHLASSLDQMVRVAPMLGDAVELYVRDARRDKHVTRLDPGDLKHIGQIVTATTNRFVLAVLLVGMMLSSVLVMALPPNPSVPILPVLGTLGFGASVLLAVLMVLHLMWTFWRR